MGATRLADTFGIMSVDPGKATAYAAGVFRRVGVGERGTVKATLKRAVRKQTINCVVTDRPYWEQGHEIASTWINFLYRCNVEFAIERRHVILVVENFALRQMAVDLAPVEVASAIGTALWEGSGPNDNWVEVERPNASEAKGYATDARLKLWGLYPLAREAGRLVEHKKDALRHMALGVEKVMSGRWGG